MLSQSFYSLCLSTLMEECALVYQKSANKPWQFLTGKFIKRIAAAAALCANLVSLRYGASIVVFV